MARKSDPPGKKPSPKKPAPKPERNRAAAHPKRDRKAPSLKQRMSEAAKRGAATRKANAERSLAETQAAMREAHATTTALLGAKPAVEIQTDGLSPAHQRFVAEYLLTYNATIAYMAVYPHVLRTTAGCEGWRLLKNPRIKAEIDRQHREAIGLLTMTREDMIGNLVAIIQADPNELSHVRHVCCPHCWGNEPPKVKRGKLDMGHGKTRVSVAADPDPECEHCEGEGVEQVRLSDTRKLAGTARALFAGVKITQSGVQVLTENKAVAREQLAKMLGLYELDNHQKQSSLTEALAAFMGGIHETGSRLPIAPPKPKEAP